MNYLNKDELRRLFQAAYDSNRSHHLCMVVGLWHGARISEVLALTDADVVDGKVQIDRLKGSISNCQPIHRDSDSLFDESPLETLAALNRGRLFPFSRQRADQFVKRYAALAGIHPSKGHFHAMKHSIAMLLWDKVKDLGQIQSYLGHKAASSTLAYLRESDASKAQKAIEGIQI